MIGYGNTPKIVYLSDVQIINKNINGYNKVYGISMFWEY